MSRISKVAVRVLVAFVVLFAAIVGFTLLKNAGLLSPLGIKSETSDSQVVQSIKRTEEVSLLALGIQGITSEERCSTAFGKCVPGTSDTVYLQYTFTGKLGIDGGAVEVTESGAGNYMISVPAFEFIGYSEPKFEVAVTDDGVLSFVTEDIDQAEMITKILGEEAQQKHLDDNQEVLQQQTKVFYDNIILSVAPDAKITYEFA
ncbi:hypothetical protein L2K70_02350 [Nocardioides KLBMP 9356]|uniref:DUF4230 domain-containing protein n=1 Tax=Nocardioides potassii TaxID=2911371 RepID=A0ABS9H8T5_9ACTN|nr:hypothetical protein [Nocardioides potassii]MCF6376433.1 hypothetical protein [Nocardioides potassii]